MADTNITIPELGSLTAGQVSDLLLVTRGTTGYKMLVSDIAKTIIETYQGSSLAGSTQSVKSALDALNSNMDTLTTPLFGQVTFNTDAVVGSNTGKWWCKLGKLVMASIEFTPIEGKIVNSSVICQGLPVIDDRFPVYFQTDEIQLRVINSQGVGKLIYYFPINTSYLSRNNSFFAYITSE